MGVLQKGLRPVGPSDGLLDSVIRQGRAVVGDLRDGADGEHMARGQEQQRKHRDKKAGSDHQEGTLVAGEKLFPSPYQLDNLSLCLVSKPQTWQHMIVDVDQVVRRVYARSAVCVDPQ